MNEILQKSIQRGKEARRIKTEGDLMSTEWSAKRRLANKWVEIELPRLIQLRIAEGFSWFQLGDPNLRQNCNDLCPENSFTKREIAGVVIHSKIIAAACITAGLPVVKRLFSVIGGCMPNLYAYNDYYIDIKNL